MSPAHLGDSIHHLYQPCNPSSTVFSDPSTDEINAAAPTRICVQVSPASATPATLSHDEVRAVLKP